MAADVTDAASVDQLVTEALRIYGDLHVIMTAAGNPGPTGDTRQIDIDEFDRHFALNVRGTFLCVQRALRHFAHKRYGKVVDGRVELRAGRRAGDGGLLWW